MMVSHFSPFGGREITVGNKSNIHAKPPAAATIANFYLIPHVTQQITFASREAAKGAKEE